MARLREMRTYKLQPVLATAERELRPAEVTRGRELRVTGFVSARAGAETFQREAALLAELPRGGKALWRKPSMPWAKERAFKPRILRRLGRKKNILKD